jgi:hypothetical protein
MGGCPRAVGWGGVGRGGGGRRCGGEGWVEEELGSLCCASRGGWRGSRYEKWGWADSGVDNRGVSGGGGLTKGNTRLTGKHRTFRRPACGAGL